MDGAGGPLTIADATGTIHLALFERPAEACRSTIALGATAAEFCAWRLHLGSALGRSIEAVHHRLSWSHEYAALAPLLREAGG